MKNTTAAAPTEKIGLGEKTAFACGEIYGSGAVALLSLVYFMFLTQILHIGAGWAGTIILLSKVWDAVSDPLMGVISDNTRSKYGRRRPYIFASAFLIIASMVLLFLPIQSWSSEAAKIVYVIFAYIVYSTVSTVFNVPYLSLTSEISQNVKVRSNMNFARTAIGMIACGVVYLLVNLLTDAHRDQILSDTAFSLTISLGFGVFFAVPVLCSAIFCNERTPLPEKKTSFSFKNFARTFKLKCFRRLLIMYVFSFVCNEIVANLLIIFVYNISGGHKMFGMSLSTLVNMTMLVSAGLVMPAVFLALNKKVPKPVIFMCGLPLYLIGAVALAFFPSTQNPNWMVLCSAIAGLGYGTVQVIPWLTFPDVVDVAELKSNDRNPGAYNGTMTFFKKFSTGLAVFLVGQVLALAGYDSNLGTAQFQPAGAVTGMRIAIGVAACVLLTIAFVGATLIRITTRKSERIRYYIDKQRAGELESLSAEDQTEYEQLKKELF